VGEITVRRAIAEDADVLAELRRDMQAELIAADGLSRDADELVEGNRAYFREALSGDEFVGFVAEESGRILATSGMVLYRAPPTFGNPSGTEGFVMNMYTVPEARGHGLATKLVDALVSHARDVGARRVWLRASQFGKPVYERYGFETTDHYMQLRMG
jgi:GNAT superfamily N-acetyltransferase